MLTENITSEIDDEKQGEINAMKILLRDTDYIAIKHSEGLISDEEYAETKAKRQAWRDRINEFEK